MDEMTSDFLRLSETQFICLLETQPSHRGNSYRVLASEILP